MNSILNDENVAPDFLQRFETSRLNLIFLVCEEEKICVVRNISVQYYR